MKLNKKTIVVITSIILMFSLSIISFADSEQLVKTYKIKESEEKEFVENKLKKDITEEEKNYNFDTYSKKIIDDVKTETRTDKKINLNSRNEEYLRTIFANELKSEEVGYEGTLKLKDFTVEVVKQGNYEEIDTKEIIVENLSENDLNNIAKERNINGIKYYLIRTDWNVSQSKEIDNVNVPTKYSGKAIYQTVLTKEYPDKYNVTANYEGTIEKIDKEIEYTVSYNEIPKIQENQEEKSNIPQIILISGLGIIIIAILYVFIKGNAIIYNNIDGQFVKIAKIRLKKNKKIGLDKYAFKTQSNNYKIKIDKRTFNKFKNSNITFIKNNKEIKANIEVEEFTFNI